MSFLLFDLDGTISDPLQGIGRSINYTLRQHGYSECPIETLAQYVGPPIDGTFKQLTGVTDKQRIAAFIETYRQRYGEIGYAENTVYPGIIEVIQSLSLRSIRMGICTSKRQDFADKILKMFDLRHYFEWVSGGDVGIEKGQQIAELLEKNYITHDAIMVGDRAVDLIAAHQHGLRSVGVMWGYGSRAELEVEHPYQIVEEPEALNGLV